MSSQDPLIEPGAVKGTIPSVHTCASTGAWQHDAANLWQFCNTCGKKINKSAHTFEWVIDKEATATEEGSKHEECTVCGYEKAAVETPAAATSSDTDTGLPQTGDNSNITLWIETLPASGITLISSILFDRKRKYNR